MAFCGKCGSSSNQGDNFCRSCGASLNSSSNFTEATPPPMTPSEPSGEGAATIREVLEFKTNLDLGFGKIEAAEMFSLFEKKGFTAHLDEPIAFFVGRAMRKPHHLMKDDLWMIASPSRVFIVRGAKVGTFSDKVKRWAEMEATWDASEIKLIALYTNVHTVRGGSETNKYQHQVLNIVTTDGQEHPYFWAYPNYSASPIKYDAAVKNFELGTGQIWDNFPCKEFEDNFTQEGVNVTGGFLYFH